MDPTKETPAVDKGTQPLNEAEPKVDPQPEGEKEPKAPEGAPLAIPDGMSKSDFVRELEQKAEKDPRYEYSEAELDVLDDFYENGDKDSQKSKSKYPDKKSEKPDEKKEKDENEEGEKPDEKKEKSSSKKDNEELDPDTTSSTDMELMKEVGAKSKSELLQKVKDLRKAISSKWEKSPQYKQTMDSLEEMKRTIGTQERLWNDTKKGDDKALEFFKKHFNLVPAGTENSKPSSKPEVNSGKNDTHFDTSKFVDDEAAGEVNKAFGKMSSTIDALSKRVEELADSNRKLSESDKKRSESDIRESTYNKAVEEMVQVAAKIPSLQGEKNIRQRINNWYRRGADDPKLEYFQDLIEIANDRNVDLPTAWEIDRGRKAELEIANAKSEGRREAYEQEPNRSLSDMQGRKGERFETITDSEFEAMLNGEANMPDDWFDKEDNIVVNKVPKKFQHHFT